jgi:hypothetical protein
MWLRGFLVSLTFGDLVTRKQPEHVTTMDNEQEDACGLDITWFSFLSATWLNRFGHETSKGMWGMMHMTTQMVLHMKNQRGWCPIMDGAQE